MAITTSLTLFFLLLHFSTRLQAYTSEEVFTINCGTTGKSSDDQRTWTGDEDTKHLTFQDTTVSDKATTQSPSANQVPFSTARLSRSQFNYSFPVSPGTKFVRLFFYPTDYPSFPRTHASFSVQSNKFILLNDFNASLNADAQATDTIFKEYVVNVNDGERLILTFTPSHPNSYAFINGIEVLSMPTDLYYTTNETGFTNVGTSILYSVGTSFALQTEYRIKAGGQEISPYNDSGLFRDWAAEERYFIKHNPKNDDLPADMDGKMNITVNPDYLAPKELFRTARSMGRNATLNRMSNLTWEFPVDYGFTYVLRLHFCELDPNINKIGDRQFHIYIASQVADDRADVMKWSQQQKGLPVHRNYGVLIPKNGAQKKFNLSLQMHPYESSVDSRYQGAFLNGLEIFKISDSNNLAGPNPDPVQTPQNNIPGQIGKISSGSATTIISAIAGVLSGVILIFIIVFLVVFLRYKRNTYTKSRDCESKSTTIFLPTDLCRRFSIAEMREATQNFDEVLIVGSGGFGQVYKGYIDEGSVPVAIKRLKPDSQQGVREFLNEIKMLSQLRHLNLVTLIGYCNDNKEMILVYDFMTRGNLRDHLYNTDNPAISWKQRLQICIGAARGLHYLHTGAKHTIIHRDVKSTNILLDDKWVAKVSDFGLSRLGPIGTSKAHVSTDVRGSFGYMDPEYYKRYRLTEKSDVYSFGVVLFEILCGRPPLIHSAEKQQVSLSKWVKHCYESGMIADIVEPTLEKEIAVECLKKFCEIGMSCLVEDGSLRPSMEDVARMLEFTLQLQESKSTTIFLPTDLCRRFSIAEMRAATQNFDEVLIVGSGGFGQVYKGYIDEGSVPVAIKRLKPDSQQGVREFLNEIKMLSQLRHLNLVTLIGYCNDNKEMILVYDFMTRGNLRDHLYNTDNPAISWKQRLQICIGAARGLHYLHTGAKHTIIHRDVKSTNILLDDKWVAKVSDFGLSRLGPIGTSKAHVSTDVRGSFGYMDPEYYKRYRLTEKFDVYSFGVVLFEILCGRPPLIHSAEKQQVSLSKWVKHCYESGMIADIVEPTLKKEIAVECLKKFCEIGMSCLVEDGSLRPCMEDVARLLEFTLQLQESGECKILET